MTTPEFSRKVTLARLPNGPVTLAADAAERARLAGRFGLPAITRLEATLTLTPNGETIDAHGRLSATFAQGCAIAGDAFDNTLEEPLAIRFVPALAALAEDQEYEFAPDDPDEIEYSDGAIDLGEAVAQSFGLALDPYATGPNAEAARRAAGLGDGAGGGAFAALQGLLKRED